jgi:hypothetical protein
MNGPVIINTGARYRPARLAEPSATGYLHLAAEIDPPSAPGPVRSSPTRNEALAQLSHRRQALASRPATTVELYRAAMFPPLSALAIPERYQHDVARFDVIVLIKTAAVGDLPSVEEDLAYRGVLDALHQHARKVTITRARSARRIADVGPGDRLHLFNHFLTDNPAALDVWDYLAGWYQQEMGLTNSEVMAPLDSGTSPFAFINHASWNISLPGFVSRQLTRRSFRTFVTANLRANDMSSLPYLYRPAATPRQGADDDG